MRLLHTVQGYPDRVIYQETEMFSFSLDTLVLAGLTDTAKKYKKVLDIGTNNGIVPLLLSSRMEHAEFTGIEIQHEAAELARENVIVNDLEDKITIVEGDVKDSNLPLQYFDLIVCNPPFFTLDNVRVHKLKTKELARHEVNLTLAQLCESCRKLSRDGTMITFVHRANRLAEIMHEMKKNNIEPKDLTLIYTKADKPPLMVHITGKYRGNPGLHINKPFIVHNEDGSYSEQAKTKLGYE